MNNNRPTFQLNPIKNRYRTITPPSSFSIYSNEHGQLTKNAFELEKLREEIIKLKYEHSLKRNEWSAITLNLSSTESEWVYNINTIERILLLGNKNNLPEDIHTAWNRSPMHNKDINNYNMNLVESKENQSNNTMKMNGNNNNSPDSGDKQSQLIQMLRNKNTELEKRFEIKESEIQNFKTSNKGIKINKLTNTLQDHTKELKELTTEYNTLKKWYDDLCLRTQRAYDEKCNYSQINSKLRTQNDFYISKTKNLKTENDEWRKKLKIYFETQPEGYDKEKKMLHQRIDNLCTMNESYEDKIEKKQKEIQKISQEIEAVQDKNNKLRREVSANDKVFNIQETNKKIATETEKVTEKKNEIEEFNKKINEVENNINKETSNLSKLESKLEQERNKNTALEEIIQEWQDKRELYWEDYNTNNIVIEKLEKELNELSHRNTFK